MHPRFADRPAVAPDPFLSSSLGAPLRGPGGDPSAMASSCNPAREEPMPSGRAALDPHSDTSDIDSVWPIKYGTPSELCWRTPRR
jgi:hypothetical protein